MSSPIPWQEPHITKEDLGRYLASMNKAKREYEVENLRNPDEYNDRMIKKLNDMAWEGIVRYHEQSYNEE